MDKCNSRDHSAKSNRRRIRSGWRKRQFETYRESQTDDNDHDLAIHARSYGAGGQYGNTMVKQTESKTRASTLHGKRKRCQDLQDEEEEAQHPAKHPKLGSSDYENLAIIGLTRAMANLTHVTTKPASSSSTGSRKRPFTSSCKSDDDDESKARIRQRLSEPYENMIVNQTEDESHGSSDERKICQVQPRDDEETSCRQQTAKTPNCLFSFRKEFIFLPAFGVWSIRVSVSSLACFIYLTFFRQIYLQSILLKHNLMSFNPHNPDDV